MRSTVWYLSRVIANLLQTKETLTLRSTSFGSKCELPPMLLDKILKAGLSDSIIKFAEFKSQKDLKKGDGSKRSRLVGEGVACCMSFLAVVQLVRVACA